jgi:hypothetical protein
MNRDHCSRCFHKFSILVMSSRLALLGCRSVVFWGDCYDMPHGPMFPLPCTKRDEIGRYDGHQNPAEADRHPVVQIKKLIVGLEAMCMDDNCKCPLTNVAKCLDNRFASWIWFLGLARKLACHSKDARLGLSTRYVGTMIACPVARQKWLA